MHRMDSCLIIIWPNESICSTSTNYKNNGMTSKIGGKEFDYRKVISLQYSSNYTSVILCIFHGVVGISSFLPCCCLELIIRQFITIPHQQVLSINQEPFALVTTVIGGTRWQADITVIYVYWKRGQNNVSSVMATRVENMFSLRTLSEAGENKNEK